MRRGCFRIVQHLRAGSGSAAEWAQSPPACSAGRDQGYRIILPARRCGSAPERPQVLHGEAATDDLIQLEIGSLHDLGEVLPGLPDLPSGDAGQLDLPIDQVVGHVVEGDGLGGQSHAHQTARSPQAP
mgnify:CR=1 FL=1